MVVCRQIIQGEKMKKNEKGNGGKWRNSTNALNQPPMGKVKIRDIEHDIACFSCHEIKPEYANMHITDPKVKRAFGVLVVCKDCSDALHAKKLRMQPPMTFPVDPENEKVIFMPPATGKKPQ